MTRVIASTLALKPALAGAVFLTASTLLLRSFGFVAAPDQSAPPFDARASGPGVILSWNRQAPELRDVQRATILIEDGSQWREFELADTSGQGNLFYTPHSSAAKFHLRLQRGETLNFLTKAWSRPETKSIGQAFIPTPPPSPSRPATKQPRLEEVLSEAIYLRLSEAAPVLRRVQPVVPSHLLPRTKEKELTFPVFIKVDAKGSVVAASTVQSDDRGRKALANIALEAAKQWRFRADPKQPGYITRDIALQFKLPSDETLRAGVSHSRSR